MYLKSVTFNNMGRSKGSNTTRMCTQRIKWTATNKMSIIVENMLVNFAKIMANMFGLIARVTP
eukprot:3953253-Prorocentrum_lima.AAC.1